jgi:ADP-heptose:LPS heptosyltransferase
MPKSLEELKASAPNKLILRNFQSPGDLVTLTALIRDIHKSYPGIFMTDAHTSCPAIFENNPFITQIDEHDPDAITLKCDYPLIHESNEAPFHFIHGFIQDFNSKMNLNVKPSLFKGDIHISPEERGWMSQVQEITKKDEKYWIVVSGGKHDYTAKWWNPNKLQKVVNMFKGVITFVQVGESKHHHPELNNVIDLRGKTDLRQLIRVIYNSAGIICPVTSLMHFSAAIEYKWDKDRIRPCIVVAGGREGNHWEAYPGHQYLHTIGMLDCCKHGGCWKSKIGPLDGSKPIKNTSYCSKPTLSLGDVIIPKCLDMISEYDVIKAVQKYLEYP